MSTSLCILWVLAAVGAEPAAAGENDTVQVVIDEVEKACLERGVPMVGRKKAERLAELVRRARPKLVVECGTAIGYSGLWIARELKKAGEGKLITLEISPERAREAQEYFRRAGLDAYITTKVGDAREAVKEIEGPIDFLFLDCGYSNYHPIFVTVEPKLSPKATVVADNAGIGARGMQAYLDHVRSKYQSRTEWFDVDLPWARRDAMEVTIVAEKGQNEE